MRGEHLMVVYSDCVYLCNFHKLLKFDIYQTWQYSKGITFSKPYLVGIHMILDFKGLISIYMHDFRET